MKNKGQVSAWEILIIILLAGVLGLIFWYSIVKSTQTQKADTINNFNYNLPKMGFGCMRITGLPEKNDTKADNSHNNSNR
jgi:hypothetical protein